MTKQDASFSPSDLLEGFKREGGWINDEVFGLKQFDSMGYGAIARTDIPEDTPLFRIPNRLLLTPYSSNLGEHLTSEELESLGYGWTRLIFVMMWEESKGSSSKWGSYLGNMPTTFDTPMFWKDEELIELKGTDIESRIGKEQAENDYRSKVEPILKAHPDIFPSNQFNLEAYHLQGSRVLSRSFTIPHSRILRATSSSPQNADEENGDEEEEREEVDWDEAVMVPIADMLNAAYQRDNARLFDCEDDDELPSGDFGGGTDGYMMISTKQIKAGEQIFNTYDSPPNSELLRKYGHVDVFPLERDQLSIMNSEEIGSWPFGNPGDEVEISGDQVVEGAKQIWGRRRAGIPPEAIKERVDEWLENGQEDSFYVSFSSIVDPGMVAFARMLLDNKAWERFKRKGKLPDTELDRDTAAAIDFAISARSAKYNGTLEDDLKAIQGSAEISASRKRAMIVRIGEKRLLHMAQRKARETANDLSSTVGEKRKAEDGDIEMKQAKR